MTQAPFTLGARPIGPGLPVCVVAELSANHGQDLARARELIALAAQAGADAVKFQTYTPDTLTLDSSAPAFVHHAGSLWQGRSLHALYREAYTPWEWLPALRDVALAHGLEWFSTAFDPSAVEFLDDLGCPVHKAASFEIVDLPLIARMAASGKPLLLSTGMASLEEIADAVAAARQAGAGPLALLKCTSAYPAPAEAMNLRTLPDLATRFGVPVGLSDHSLGLTVPLAAVALGACLVEKHFCRSRREPGPDSGFSMEPQEFADMVAAVRVAERALGEVRYGPGPHELESVRFRRSLWVVADVAAGEALSPDKVRSLRPAGGLACKHLPEVLGRRARASIARGTPLAWEHLQRG
jgi:pseudaminic acid synthase